MRINLEAFSTENALRMRGYKEILDPRDFRALRDGKVSFTEVDEELSQKKACEADAATSTPQENTISYATNCSL